MVDVEQNNEAFIVDEDLPASKRRRLDYETFEPHDGLDDGDISTATAVDVPRSLPLHKVSTSSNDVPSDGALNSHADASEKNLERGSAATSHPPPVPATLHTDHLPKSLPTFRDPNACMWTSSHAANSPSEDRSGSLVNVLLRPDHEEPDKPPCLVRLSLWSVVDGHGGGCVATYVSEVLLPYIAASISRALDCSIVDRGTCMVNGELRDANALDLDGLIQTSDRNRAGPNSIHYRSPFEGSEDEEEEGVGEQDAEEGDGEQDAGELFEEEESLANRISPSIHAPIATITTTPSMPRNLSANSVSSVKTSVKTIASHLAGMGPVGTHSPSEVAKITRAITESFLAVDEGWINSIDPIATHQTSCQTNGRWNAGACALVVFTVQRLEWTLTGSVGKKAGVVGVNQYQDTSHNKDAARRRMLDYANKGKCISSLSTVSSASSVVTNAEDGAAESSFESELTEDDYDGGDKEDPKTQSQNDLPRPPFSEETLIKTPGGCACHSYRAHDAMLYTAHVGDCRAVLLGSAPPRTIKVGLVPGADPSSSTEHSDTTDDESSYHSSDETECLSSSDHEAESSDDEELSFKRRKLSTPPYLNFMRRPARRQLRRSPRDPGHHAPFVALPPLERDELPSDEESETEGENKVPRVHRFRRDTVRNADDNFSMSTQDTRQMSPTLHLAPFTRPIDLTTDHSAYNPAEVSAVLRRSNNAPKAISAGVGGGIKRVAGSLAVTRAFGDAYLKTPRLSFSPYKNFAPYITSRPEVNCRLLTKDGDRVLIVATDGVWERCNGEDVMRWVKKYSAEKMAEAERRSNRRRGIASERPSQDENGTPAPSSPKVADAVGQKRGLRSPAAVERKRNLLARRGRRLPISSQASVGAVSSVADMIVRRVLNRVRRARNMTSLHALMTLPKGRARRSKHDDITASVVDLTAFVS
jgi:serine/threonine protein phosphatase PrpC